MTQEQKQLLLKDLCARLPYGVNIQYDNGHIVEIRELGLGSLHDFIFNDVTVKSYLRPMSSMTEEEREELSDYLCERVMSNKIGITIPPKPTQGKGIPFIWMCDCIDWLNKHHFDYRSLISMGLALEAPKDMYEF